MKNAKFFRVILTLIILSYAGFSFSQETLVLNSSTTFVQDALVGSIVPENNYGSTEDLHIYNWTQGGILNTVRTFLEFDLSVLPENIEIVSAELFLFFNYTSQYGDGHSGKNKFYVKRIISDWDEDNVTWNSQPQTTTENRVKVPNSIDPHQNYVIDVTNLLMDMIGDPSNSFGFMMRHVKEKPYKINLLASSNHSDISLHPELIITYNVIVSTNDVNSHNGITIYPNPTDSKIIISNTNEYDTPITKIRVRNIHGVLLKEYHGNQEEIQIFEKGIYLVEVWTSNGKSVQKIVVN